MDLPRNPTRAVAVGSVIIGDHNPIVVQSMCATRTQDTDATTRQTNALHEAGAGIVRIALPAAMWPRNSRRLIVIIAPGGI